MTDADARARPRGKAGGFFSHIAPIAYEGPETDNPLAFRFYDKDRLVLGKRMEDQIRPAVCYWHSFVWNGFDIFGEPGFDRPWHRLGGQAMAEAKLDAAFDFISRLGVPYFTFHDIDVMAPAANLGEHTENLAAILPKLEAKMAETGIKLLWGTANLTFNRRYMGGAGTNPNPEVFACAATQVRQCLEATQRLGGENYVFWGGREGYDTLLNTDIGRELDHLGRLITLAVEHKHKIGFQGTILIEPKPHEPAKHMYDRDVSTVYGFLKRYGLENEVKVNIETNHATLAGSPMDHEVATALALGIFGSIDANRGDPQNGWDTDQFWMDPVEIARTFVHLLKAGGFTTGGMNFDAKVRRQSVDAEDLFHGHIGGLDAMARGLTLAARLIESGELDAALAERYAGWNGPLGRWIEGGASLEEIADQTVAKGVDPKPRSGRQELLENRLLWKL
jgi:xylose isomerase